MGTAWAQRGHAMAIHKLTTTNISTEGLHSDGGNLYLQVSIGAGGAIRRSWVFRYQVGKRTRDMGLGSLDTFGLGEARDRARACRQLLADGIDPIAHRDAERARKAAEAAAILTFDQAAEIYVREHRDSWSPIHAGQWIATLRDHVSEKIGALPVASIGTPHVRAVLDPIWRTKSVTAMRVRGRIEAVLGFCIAAGYRAGDNPARWTNHLDKLLPAIGDLRDVKRQPALPFGEMPAFMAELRAREGMLSLALQFLCLTVVRSHDVRHARRQDIDRAGKLWVIPKLSKTGCEHRVPLSPAALAVLDKAAEIVDAIGGRVAGGGLAFPNDITGAPLGKNGMLWVLAAMGLQGRMTAHGARAAFKTWATEATNFPRELSELCLGHAVGDAVEQAYLRGDALRKRVAIMSAWSSFLAKPAVTADGKVVAIHARP
jgi:integrase